MLWHKLNEDRLSLPKPQAFPGFIKDLSQIPYDVEEEKARSKRISIGSVVGEVLFDPSVEDLNRSKTLNFLAELVINDTLRQSVVDIVRSGLDRSIELSMSAYRRKKQKLRNEAAREGRPVVKSYKKDRSGFEMIFSYLSTLYLF